MTMKLNELGYFRLALASPELKMAYPKFNTESIIALMKQSVENNCNFVLFPELCVTGYYCQDLFYQKTLLKASLEALEELKVASVNSDCTIVVGLPVESDGRLYNCAALISNGSIAAIIPKTYIPNTYEYYERRWFSSETERISDYIEIEGERVPFGADILVKVSNYENCKIGIEICEDLWSLKPPSFDMAAAGANVILNLSASDEYLGKSKYRRELVKSQSARCLAAYAYSAAGCSESTTDLVFSGHCIGAECGVVLRESERFVYESNLTLVDFDLHRINNDRIKNASFASSHSSIEHRVVRIELPDIVDDKVNRYYSHTPFVPSEKFDRSEVCEEIFSIQTAGFEKRLRHTGLRKAVIGVSGGLDSTLALLATARAFARLNYNLSGIIAISMPGFGTSNHTRNNAQALSMEMGTGFREISIDKAVRQHFEDIQHEESQLDIVYENSQARERTQILFDIANKENALVVGTGDLSELALGWCTYGGDHLSMYGVNCGIPKTLVRYIIEWCGEELYTGEVSKVLQSICTTPISPELLPTSNEGEIAQLTEASIGPYILNDFFLYYFLRMNFSPDKILFIADLVFKDSFSREKIKDALNNFCRRFFSNQFKRSCLPDGPKVGSVSLSPRGDWRMPSDAEVDLWLMD